MYKHPEISPTSEDMLGGHARHILPPLSRSQPVIADEEVNCWGTFLNFFAIFVLCMYISYHVHACGVRVGIFEHGALGICISSVRTYLRPVLCPLHSHFGLFYCCERA